MLSVSVFGVSVCCRVLCVGWLGGSGLFLCAGLFWALFLVWGLYQVLSTIGFDLVRPDSTWIDQFRLEKVRVRLDSTRRIWWGWGLLPLTESGAQRLVSVV